MDTMTMTMTEAFVRSDDTTGLRALCVPGVGLGAQAHWAQPVTGALFDTVSLVYTARIKDIRPGSRAWSPPV